MISLPVTPAQVSYIIAAPDQILKRAQICLCGVALACWAVGSVAAELVLLDP